ncbi:MAG TPA: polysaccharide biosynthesis protein [Candidatus Merdenecus merdavium]|nr:polysaccharide biosynthesis protein [Candidatus Merdenecus merdavium]
MTRIIGFFYRIFLSHTIGPEGMGIYQLIFPIYALCFSLTAAGIQTAISRFVAWKVSLKDEQAARDILLVGLTISMILSIGTTILLYLNADFLAINILDEPRCGDLLRIVSLSIPFGCVHSCVNGYYYGIKKANVPALSQLIEQLIRVFASYVIYLMLKEQGHMVGPAIAAIGIVLGEFVSMLFSATAIIGRFQKFPTFKQVKSPYFTHAKNILSLSLPLTANRILLNVLQSAEAILIPIRLRLYGFDTSEALSVYGVLTGMSLPLILFPSAITNSVAVMLLPTISEAQASDNHRMIARTIENTIKYCLILGILCTGTFLLFGSDLGTVFFDNSMAGSFILVLAWICPFLYLTTTLNSILNGLGKTTTSFIHHCIGLGTRILFVLFCIPKFGITGYLWGLLVSELIMTLLHIIDLKKYANLYFSAYNWIMKPLISLGISIGVVRFFQKILDYTMSLTPLLHMGVSFIILCITYILLLTAFGSLTFDFFHSFMKRKDTL